MQKLLSAKQYSFINSRSTTTQFLTSLSKCIDTIVAERVVDTIYSNFAKPFDSVLHQRFLGKFRREDGKILKSIKALLSNRCQIVKVNGIKLDPATVLNAILQGSVLGPILFCAYI